MSQPTTARADRLTAGMFIRLAGRVVRVLSAKLHRDGTVQCKHDLGDAPLATAQPQGSTWLDAGETVEVVTAQCRRAAA